MLDLGMVRPGSTIRIPFATFDKDDGSSITMTNFAVGDILIYKDGGTTERASTTGFTATTDFDAKTGKHVAVIDLSSNATAGFFAAGSEYLVAIDAVTVDGITTGGWIARFCIGYPQAILNTTIASLSSQTSFTLTAGPAEDDALNGQWAIIHDVASAVQWALVQILDYTGSTKTVTLVAGATFTVAAADNFCLMGPMPLQSGGAVSISSGGITATSFAADALTAAKVAADVGAEIATAVRTELTTELGNLDAAVSTRLASASYTAPPSAATIAAAVWDYLTSAATTVGSLGKLIVDNLNATVSSRSSHAAADVWSVATRVLTAGTNIVLAKGTGVTGFTDLDAAGVRSAVGLASANLDTQLAAIDDYIDTEVAAILLDTGTTLDDLVDDLETRLTAALATKLAAHAAGVLAVVIGTGSTTTAVVLSTVEGAAPSAVDDFYNGAVLILTSGALAGQRTDITDYAGATVTATVTALTGAPANGVTALIV